MAAKRNATIDLELKRIDDLEAAMIQAHDEKHTLGGAPLEEVQRFRPEAVRLAKAICDQLREEYRARKTRETHDDSR